MQKRLLLLLLILICVFRNEGMESKLNLFIWSEYIDPEIITDFEKEYRCKVVMDLYEDEASMMAKIRSGGAGLYDVVVPPDHTVTGLIRLGLIAPIRHQNIPNLKNIGERFLSPPYDPGNRYTVPYQWGTIGIYVRNSIVSNATETWGLIFSPKLQPKAFSLIDSPRDLIGVALKYRGHSVNSVDLSHLKEARDLIVQAKKRCVGFDGSVGAKNKVLSRIAHAAIVYNGDAARGMVEDPDTSYLIPREGSQIWQDNLAVLTNAPHRDLAEQFINFLLKPEIGGRISNYTQYASPNLAARPYINPDDLNNPVIYPSSETMARLEFLKDRGSMRRLYDEVWTQIKTR